MRIRLSYHFDVDFVFQFFCQHCLCFGQPFAGLKCVDNVFGSFGRFLWWPFGLHVVVGSVPRCQAFVAFRSGGGRQRQTVV